MSAPGGLPHLTFTTTDLSKSKEFYGTLFKWTFNPVQGTNLAVEILSGGSSSGRFELGRGKSVPSTAWSMFRYRTFRRAATRRKNWVERSFPDSPSTSQTAREPSGL